MLSGWSMERLVHRKNGAQIHAKWTGIVHFNSLKVISFICHTQMIISCSFCDLGGWALVCWVIIKSIFRWNRKEDWRGLARAWLQLNLVYPWSNEQQSHGSWIKHIIASQASYSLQSNLLAEFTPFPFSQYYSRRPNKLGFQKQVLGKQKNWTFYFISGQTKNYGQKAQGRAVACDFCVMNFVFTSWTKGLFMETLFLVL